MKFLNHIDLNKLELRNAAIQALASAPSTPSTGQVYFDTGTGKLLIYNGSAWSHKASDSDLLGGQNLAYTLARANQTGTQTASTISDLATVVKAYKLNEFGAPVAAVSLGSQKITNLATPTASTDAANMQYVQDQVANAAAGIDCKASVRVVAASNITLSGTQTIDGVAVVAGDRVLAEAQTTGAQNGVYIVAAGAWSRAVDADGVGEITPGAFWYVEEGSTYGKTQWRVENTGTITLGSTAITINQFGGAINYSASNGINLTGTSFTGVVAGGGGLSVSGSGFAVDTTVVARKFSQSIGDGSATSLTVTHNLGTSDPIVQVKDAAGNVILADIATATTNTITVGFASAPAANAYRVTVIG